MSFDGTYDHYSVRLGQKFGGEISMSVWVKSEDPKRRHNTIVEMGSRFSSSRQAKDYQLDFEEEYAAAPIL
jgi:hypothetical protein